MNEPIKKVHISLSVLLGFTITYVLIRDIIMFSRPYALIPYVLFNKAFAWAAASALTLSTTIKVLSNFLPEYFETIKKFSKTYFGASVLFAAIHVLFTLFGSGFHISTNAGTSGLYYSMMIAFGIFCFAAMLIHFFSVQYKSRPNVEVKNQFSTLHYKIIMLLLTFLHVSFHVFSCWTPPKDWPAYLPPVSLFVGLDLFLGIMILIFFYKKAERQEML